MAEVELAYTFRKVSKDTHDPNHRVKLQDAL